MSSYISAYFIKNKRSKSFVGLLANEFGFWGQLFFSRVQHSTRLEIV